MTINGTIITSGLSHNTQASVPVCQSFQNDANDVRDRRDIAKPSIQ